MLAGLRSSEFEAMYARDPYEAALAVINGMGNTVTLRHFALTSFDEDVSVFGSVFGQPTGPEVLEDALAYTLRNAPIGDLGAGSGPQLDYQRRISSGLAMMGLIPQELNDQVHNVPYVMADNLSALYAATRYKDLYDPQANMTVDLPVLRNFDFAPVGYAEFAGPRIDAWGSTGFLNVGVKAKSGAGGKVVSAAKTVARYADQSGRNLVSGLNAGAQVATQAIKSAKNLGFATTTKNMRLKHRGDTFFDPASGKYRTAKKGEKISPDHVYPVQKILTEIQGVNKLDKTQLKYLIRDTDGKFGNISGLPSSINQSKGARLGNEWKHYKGTPIPKAEQQRLYREQIQIKQRMQRWVTQQTAVRI